MVPSWTLQISNWFSIHLIISQQLLMFASRIPYRKISEFYPDSPSISKPNPHCLHNTCLYPVPIGYVMLYHNYPDQQVLCRSLICSQSDTQGTWSVASRPSPGYCPGRIEPVPGPTINQDLQGDGHTTFFVGKKRVKPHSRISGGSILRLFHM